jgi:hypothetical protein
MTRRLLLLATLLPTTLGVLLAASPAMAAKPTKKECAAANESAQDLRTAGRLREARASLAVCTAASCPGAIREDCAQRLKEVEAAIPSVVFVVRDSSGKDLSDVHVNMDGAPLLEKLDGTSVTIDPGEHHFTFESDAFRTGETTVIVREGDSNRQVRVILKSTTAPESTEAAPAAAPAKTETHESAPLVDGSTRRSLGLSLGAAGAAGLILGGVFGLVSKVTYEHGRDECGGDVKTCSGPTRAAGARDVQSAFSQATVSTVGFVGGGALLAGGALLYFTAPKSDDVAVSATVSSGGGALSVCGRW